jgi:pantothenate kinase-related protein Tda10
LDFNRGYIIDDDNDKNEEDINRKIVLLTQDQKGVFDEITSIIEEQTSQIDSKKQISFCYFTSGEGGVGKSFLLELLDEFLTCKYTKSNDDQTNKPSVVICAPSGIS